MSKGLTFLNKKGWHPLTMKNQERVWKAEQQQAAEQKRIQEIKRQYNEQAKQEEFRAMKRAAGLGKEKAHTGMEWMYEGPAAQVNRTDESLKMKPTNPVNDHKDQKTNPNAMQSTESKKDLGIFRNYVSNPISEAWSKVKEDPFFEIEKLKKAKMDLVLNNPVKMEQIRKLHEQTKKELKKQKKEKKHKNKKEKKHKHKHDSDSDEDNKRDRSGSPSRDRKRKRDDSSPSRKRDDSASPSRDKKRRRDSRSSSRERRRRDSSRSPARRERSPVKKERSLSRERKPDARSPSRDRADSRSPSRHARKESPSRRDRSPAKRDRSPARRRSAERRDPSPSIKRENKDDRRSSPPKRDRSPPQRSSRSGRGSSPSRRDGGSTRRDRSPARRSPARRSSKERRDSSPSIKRENRDDRRSDRTDIKREDAGKKAEPSKAPYRRTKWVPTPMTEEERQRELDKMTKAAEDHDANLLKRLQRATDEEKKERDSLNARDSEIKPEFINKMNKKVYSGDESFNVEERLKRGAHYRQRAGDLEGGSVAGN